MIQSKLKIHKICPHYAQINKAMISSNICQVTCIQKKSHNTAHTEIMGCMAAITGFESDTKIRTQIQFQYVKKHCYNHTLGLSITIWR